MSQINNYLKRFKDEYPDSRISDKRVLKIAEYESMKLHFGEELSYEEFQELACLKEIGDVEFKENSYRSKKAKEATKHLPDDEQGVEAKKYIKRLYKWFDVILTKAEVDSFYKLNIANGDMKRHYLKYVHEA